MSNTKTPGRRKNPRREVLAVLRAARKDITTLIRWWDEAQTVTEPVTNDEGRVVNHTWRPRREDEKIENNSRHWASLSLWLTAEIEGLEALREFARDQAARLEEAAK